MRILFITNNFPPVVDGVGDYTFMLSRYLMENSWEVGVVCNKRVRADLSEIFVVTDLESSSQNLTTDKIVLFPVIPNWNCGWRITMKRVISAFKPDLISLQYVPYAFNQYGIPISMAFLPYVIGPVKLTVTFHEAAIRYSLSNIKSFPIGCIQRLIANFLAFKSCVAFTSIKHYLKYFYLRKRPLLLPVGNNLQLKIETCSKRIFEQKEVTLCTFGIRNYDTVLTALNVLKKNSSIPFRYLIIGNLSADKKRIVEHMAAKLELLAHISILGYLPAHIAFKYLQAADLFLEITYAKYKSRGGTNLKSGSFAAAMAAGLPVVGFKGDMTEDILTHGENIWFCEDATPENIASAIETVAGSPEIRERLHCGARDLYHKFLSWEAIGASYLSAINECLS